MVIISHTLVLMDSTRLVEPDPLACVLGRSLGDSSARHPLREHGRAAKSSGNTFKQTWVPNHKTPIRLFVYLFMNGCGCCCLLVALFVGLLVGMIVGLLVWLLHGLFV